MDIPRKRIHCMSRGEAAELPNKEASLFKNVVKFYEEKQYKKGVKDADKILRNSKFCEHGETLAMKGLILNCMGRKEEGYELVRRGLRNNLRSHVCWHVFGLMHRSDRNYPEAIKSYLQALRIDKENMNILRDLSLLQVQLRELPGFLETRRKMLELKANQRNNWIGFALAHHLLKQHDQAVHVLQTYEDTEKIDPQSGASENYEKSEMLLYKNMIIQESNDLDKALQHLDEIEGKVVDELSLATARANLMLAVGKFDRAKQCFSALLEYNADSAEYHTGLQCAHCQVKSKPETWSDEQTRELVSLYDNMFAHQPKAYTAQRIVLDFLKGDEFAKRFSIYVQRYLRRGIPSLFADMKALYVDLEKVAIIEAVFERFLESLRSSSVFPDSKQWEAPTVLVWVLCYLAQHHSKLRRIDQALARIEEAIAHTPTIVELYLVKARALKRGGNLVEASETCDYARKLDLQDRYLNSKCSLYLLRADKPKQAEDCMLLFTKEGDQTTNLYEMQCMWFELESGRSFLRRKDYGKALKKFHAIDKHFTDWIDDQFDFHTYCLRKMTLRPYVRLLRLEDTIHSHAYFQGAAHGMIQCYLELYDSPPSEIREDTDEADFAHLPEKERKKALSKKRRAEAKAKSKPKAADENEPKSAAKRGKDSRDEKDAKTAADEDPDGEQMMRVQSPLTEAIKYLSMLQSFCCDRIATHIIACKIYRRLDKPLLVLQSINRARKIDAFNPDLHVQIVIFAKQIENRPPEGIVNEVVSSSMREILDGRTAKSFNDAFMATANTLPPLIAAGRAAYHIGASIDVKRLADVSFICDIPHAIKGDANLRACKETCLQETTDLSLRKGLEILQGKVLATTALSQETQAATIKYLNENWFTERAC